MVLWVLSFAANIGYETLFGGQGTPGKGFGNATILLYLAVTYTVQRLVLQGCERRDAIPAVAAAGQRWM